MLLEMMVYHNETPTLFLDEIGEWLALYHNRPILTTALHDNLQELAGTYPWKAAAEPDIAAFLPAVAKYVSVLTPLTTTVAEESKVYFQIPPHKPMFKFSSGQYCIFQPLCLWETGT